MQIKNECVAKNIKFHWKLVENHQFYNLFLPLLGIIPSVFVGLRLQTEIPVIGCLQSGISCWKLSVQACKHRVSAEEIQWVGEKVLVAFNCASHIQTKYCCRLASLSLNKLHRVSSLLILVWDRECWIVVVNQTCLYQHSSNEALQVLHCVLWHNSHIFDPWGLYWASWAQIADLFPCNCICERILKVQELFPGLYRHLQSVWW